MSDIYHSQSFVELLLKYVFQKPAVFNKAKALGMTPDDFLPAGDYQLPAYKILAGLALEVDKAPIDRELLNVLIRFRSEQGAIPLSMVETLTGILGRVYTQEEGQMDDYILGELPKFLRSRRSTKILTEAAGDIDRIQQEFKKVIFPLDSISASETPIEDRFVSPFKTVLKKQVLSMISTGFGKLDACLGGGLGYRELGVVVGHSGGGKCHGKGTKILMSDGGIKKVEDILVGDLLMGEDSTSREVLSLARGKEQMYRVTPVKGESWTCNESHMLSLQVSYNYVPFKKGQVINISVRDYLRLGRKQRSCLKLYRTGVEFEEQPLEFDPYMIGLWLGDGSRRGAAITNVDTEILQYLHNWIAENKYGVRKDVITYHMTTKRGQSNPLWNELKTCMTPARDKFIPTKYLRNSRKHRLALLAGLLDSDGHYHHGHYEITSKFDSLAEDILYLARSLGFAAYNHKKVATLKSRNYSCVVNRITISGGMTEIPCKVARKVPQQRKQCKSVLRTGFSLKKLNVGDYYGFKISGNHLYLLGDFTVTHNTAMGTSFARGGALMGKKVIYCSMEEEKEDIANRMYSAVFEVDYTTLHNGSGYMELEQKMAETPDDATRRALLENNLIILDLKGLTPMKASTLKQLVDDYAIKNNYMYDLLVIDQLQFMEPEENKDGEGEWQREGRIMKEIDEITHQPVGGNPSKSFSAWVLHQAKGKVKIYFSTDEIAGFKGIVHKPETVLGLGREKPDSNDFELFSMKNRHAKNFRLPMHGDLSLMTFREKAEGPGDATAVAAARPQAAVASAMTAAGNYGDPSRAQLLTSSLPPTQEAGPAPLSP